MKETILSLVSGLIGSLVGGLITFVTTKYSLQKSLDQAVDLDNKRKKDEEKQKEQSALSAIKAELNENLSMIAEWKNFHSKFKFSDNAWETFKPELMKIDNIREKLLAVYIEVSRHNTLIDYDFRVSPGMGTYDARIEELVKKIETKITEALSLIK